MRPMALDTPPDIEEMQLEGYRRMSAEEKIQRVVELNRSVEAMAAARIKKQYGSDLPERELRLRLASLRLGREIMVKIFDWDPNKKGY